jgi:hypothetical protein
MMQGRPIPRPHVMRSPGRGTAPVTRRSHAEARAAVSTQSTVGQTAHFVVYTDGSADGNAAAQAVLAACEADFAAVQAWFGGITLPAGQEGDDQTTPRTAQPMHVLMDPQAGGAYHYGCDATDLYIAPSPPNQATGLVVAEEVEVFEAAINNGWDCGQTNGEALSRVLAIARNSQLAPITTQTAQGWWGNGHQDYVNDNSQNDQNEDGNACGSLFLYYLNSQLNYSWQQIVAAGGSSLGACYQKLTGSDPTQGFNDFVSRLATLDNGSGQLALPASGNPFPIGSTAPVPGGTSGTSTGVGAAGGMSTGVVVGIVAVVVVVLIILFATHVI